MILSFCPANDKLAVFPFLFSGFLYNETINTILFHAVCTAEKSTNNLIQGDLP